MAGNRGAAAQAGTTTAKSNRRPSKSNQSNRAVTPARPAVALLHPCCAHPQRLLHFLLHNSRSMARSNSTAYPVNALASHVFFAGKGPARLCAVSYFVAAHHIGSATPETRTHA